MTDPAQALQEARAALDAVITEIQQLPRFRNFLAAPAFDDVAEAARDHPVVYLAAAEPGGVALVVRGTDVTEVELPELTRQAVADRLRTHLDRYAAYREAEKRASEKHAAGRRAARAGQPARAAGEEGGALRTARREWDNALAGLTGWLWPTAMGPLVEELTGAAAEGPEGHRATLIPGGPLGLLPLHAAWRPDPARPTGREYVVDRVQVSYAPNARTLSAARAVAAAVPGRRVLAVAPPARANDLPMSGAEARAARLAFAGGSLERNLSAEGLLTRLARTDVLHVACHGLADLAAPLNSRLVLAPGEEVTLAVLMAQEVRIRLAVLSACETLLPGTDLPDEVVSLPTGLIQAGAAGVIASLWAVPDLWSALLMIEFYRHWREGPDDPAAALRKAQIWLRDSTPRSRVEHYDRARAWPPPSVAQEVLDALSLRAAADDEPDRPDAAMAGWAAFAHIGV
ncbi:CHAT domain-containing protein [Kitasatospora sp. NPDC056327]|uniref:CHAT domain-containing protein n=1 Tax=Kitasatospora sp. NPDC056327 TaxID=3345785 RepID=UPI0035DF0E4B